MTFIKNFFKDYFHKYFSAKKENLKKVRGFLQKILNEKKVNNKKISVIKMCVIEHCENIIRHSGADGFYTGIKIDHSCILVKIIDKGKKFNIKEYKLPDIKNRIKNGQGGKMGLHIILALSKKIVYKREKGYNINTFVF